MIAFGRQLGTMYRVACFDVPFKAEKIFEKRLDKLLAGFEIVDCHAGGAEDADGSLPFF